MPRWTLPTQLPGESTQAALERITTELNNVLAEVDQRFIVLEPQPSTTTEAD